MLMINSLCHGAVPLVMWLCIFLSPVCASASLCPIDGAWERAIVNNVEHTVEVVADHCEGHDCDVPDAKRMALSTRDISVSTAVWQEPLKCGWISGGDVIIHTRNPLQGIDKLKPNEKVMPWVLPRRGADNHYFFEWIQNPDFVHKRMILSHNSFSVESSFCKRGVQEGGDMVYRLKKIFWYCDGRSMDLDVELWANQIIIRSEWDRARVFVSDAGKLTLCSRSLNARCAWKNTVLAEQALQLGFANDGEGFSVTFPKGVQQTMHLRVEPGVIQLLFNGQEYMLIDERGGAPTLDPGDRLSMSVEVLRRLMPVIPGFQLASYERSKDTLKVFYARPEGLKFYDGKSLPKEAFEKGGLVFNLGRLVYSMNVFQGGEVVEMACNDRDVFLTCATFAPTLDVQKSGEGTVVRNMRQYVFELLDRCVGMPFGIKFLSKCDPQKGWFYRFCGQVGTLSKKRWFFTIDPYGISHTFVAGAQIALNVEFNMANDTVLTNMYYNGSNPVGCWPIDMSSLCLPGTVNYDIVAKTGPEYREYIEGRVEETQMVDLSKSDVVQWEVRHVCHDGCQQCHLVGQVRVMIDCGFLNIGYRYKTLSKKFLYKNQMLKRTNRWPGRWQGGAIIWRRNRSHLDLAFYRQRSVLVSLPSMRGVDKVGLTMMRPALDFVPHVRFWISSADGSSGTFYMRPVIRNGLIVLQWMDKDYVEFAASPLEKL